VVNVVNDLKGLIYKISKTFIKNVGYNVPYCVHVALQNYISAIEVGCKYG